MFASKSLKKQIEPIVESLLAGLVGLVIGALIMLAFGHNPLAAYRSLLLGSVGSVYSLAESLAVATPLILTALTFAVAMRGGLFNIGAEGQVYMGSLAAVSVGLLHLPAPFNLIVALLAAMIAGIVWSLPVALLKLGRGVHEVISTIMFNWIAHFFAFYLIANVLTDPKRGDRTISIIESARLTRILPTATLNTGLFISLLTVAIILFLLWRTSTGFEIRAAGYNPHASHHAGINIRKQVLRVFLIGGAVAGLAGAIQVMGRPPYYAVMSGMPQLVNLGFDGIGVAMIGRNHPIGIVFAALFFGSLMVGGRIMQFDPGVPFELVRVIEGVIILALAVPELRRQFSRLKGRWGRKE
jgi:ABC-type uncharacterized transport system permease subunit